MSQGRCCPNRKNVHAQAETVSHSQLCDMKSTLCLDSKGLQQMPQFNSEIFPLRLLPCIAPRITDLSPQCASSWQTYLVNMQNTAWPMDIPYSPVTILLFSSSREAWRAVSVMLVGTSSDSRKALLPHTTDRVTMSINLPTFNVLQKPQIMWWFI